MNKQEFLDKLKSNLRQLRIDETEKTISYYDEIISDKTEEGMTEEAVMSLGSIEDIIENILKDLSMSTLIKTKAKTGNKTLLIILAIAGFPIWISIVSVIFAFYITLWSLIIALYAIMVSLFIAAAGLLASGVISSIFSSVPTGICAAGMALVCLGIALLMIIACILSTKGIIRLSSLTWRGIKSVFITKGGN